MNKKTALHVAWASVLALGSAVSYNFGVKAGEKQFESQPKTETVEDAKTVYQQKFDSLVRHYDGEQTGLYNGFRSDVEEINDSRVGTTTKNAAIAKKANKYIADHDSTHLVLINKLNEAWLQSR